MNTCELHHKNKPHDWVGVWDAEGLWLIHKSIWNAWPGSSTPHPEAPSVGPMGQLLASLTLLQPKLLWHDALAIVLPLPAQPAISLLSLYLSLFVCLTYFMLGSRAWKPSYGHTSVNSTASPREPSPCSANIWRATRTCLTLCTSEHVNEWKCEIGNQRISTVCVEKLWASGGEWKTEEACLSCAAITL